MKQRSRKIQKTLDIGEAEKEEILSDRCANGENQDSKLNMIRKVAKD